MKTDPFAKFRRQPRSGYTVTRDREPGVTSRNTENTENLRQNPELVTRLHELHQKTDDVRAHDDDRDGDQRADENSPDIHHFSCNRCNCVTESEEPAETLTLPSTKTGYTTESVACNRCNHSAVTRKSRVCRTRRPGDRGDL